MANRRAIVKRRKAVRNIKKITRTMQLIATARFQAAMNRATASRPYVDKLAEMVADLSRVTGELSHPLMESHGGEGRSALVVVTHSPEIATRLGRPDAVATALAAALPAARDRTPSASYASVLGHARALAKADDAPFVLEVHLLRALLEIPSQSLDRALGQLGTTRVSVLHALRPLLAPGPSGDLSIVAASQLRRPAPPPPRTGEGTEG